MLKTNTPLILIGLLLMSLTLSACDILSGEEEVVPIEPLPTYTALPTYTPLPTYTEPPSPTLPPLPSATLPPLESSTPDLFAPTAAPSGLQAGIAFNSLVRSGPDTSFRFVGRVQAGDTVTVLARDLNGFWLFVRTADGVEGWVRLTQFQPGIEVGLIPLATDIPTPSVTQTPTVRPGTTTVPGATNPPSVATQDTSGYAFTLAKGGSQCILIPNWYLIAPVTIPDPAKGLPLFKPNDSSLEGQNVFSLNTASAPSGVTYSIDGTVKGVNCNGNSCGFVTFTLCVTASNSAATTTKLNVPITLIFGIQRGSVIDVILQSGIPTVVTVQ